MWLVNLAAGSRCALPFSWRLKHQIQSFFPEAAQGVDLGSRSHLHYIPIIADIFQDDYLQTKILSLELFLRVWHLLGHVIHHPPLELGWVGARCQAICPSRSLRDTAIPTRTIRYPNIVLCSTNVLWLSILGYSGTLSDQCSTFQLRMSSIPSASLISL